jgi:hypothetical protein
VAGGGGVTPSAAVASTRPSPAPDSGRAVSRIRAITSARPRDGRWASSSAARPATCGAAMDVPARAAYGSGSPGSVGQVEITQSGTVQVPSGASPPGAARSTPTPCWEYDASAPVRFVAATISASPP